MPVVFEGRKTAATPPGRVVFDSPYTEVIREAEDFQRRAAQNTPENIGREIAGPEPDFTVPVRAGGIVPLDIPAPLAQSLLENTPRVALPLGTALSLSGVGALPGAALMAGAGLAGELGSQAIEKEVTGSRDAYSIPQLLTSTALSAAPPLRLESVASPFLRMGLRGAEGAGYGALAPTLEAGLRGELPSLEDVKTGAAGGALLGIPFGAAELARVSGRMAGKSPDAQLQILDQEVKLAGNRLTPNQQRLATDTKLGLEAQIEARDAAQKAVVEQQKSMQVTAQPPEIPKSAQILAEPTAKPPSLANVATEVGTQTEGSPFALQGKLNELAAPAPTPPAVAAQVDALAGRPPVGDASTLKADRAEYDRLQAEMKRIGHDKPDTPEYQAAWQAAEDIKNRHGGFVPEVQSGAENWVRGESQRNANGDLFFSTSEEIAGDFGGVRPIRDSERPKKTLNVDSKVELAEKIGYDGDPLAEPLDTPIAKRFDTLAKEYAKKNGYDSIRYESGTFEEPELHVFKQGEPTNAIREQEATGRVLRGEASQPEQFVELPGVVEENRPVETPANQVRESALQEPLSEAQFLSQSTPPLDVPPGRSAEAIRAAATRRQQRGAVSTKALLPAGGAVTGGVTGFVLTDREPGETDEEYQARRLRNAALSAVAGAGAGAAINSLAKGAQLELQAKRRAPRSGQVPLPEAESGQGIRQTAEKVITNREYPEQLRQTLAEDPDILYDKFALSDLADRVSGASVEELVKMRGSPNIRERLGATAELANRYSLSEDPALQQEGAALYSQLAQNLTNPAQMLGLGKLVKTPGGYVSAINETLKKVDRTLSQTQETQLTKLAAESIKSEQELSRATRLAEQDFTEANEAAYRAAQQKNAKAKLDLDNFVHQVAPESWGDITGKIIQGNLLTPLSLVANVFGNVVFQPVRRSSSALASALDQIYSSTTGRPKVLSRLNPLPSVAELKAAGEGVKVGARELLTGPGEDSYVKAEIQRGFRPLRSLVQSFTGEGLAVRPDGTVALNDRAKKFIEGTLGAPAETMFRFLSLGDKPFRRAAEVELLMEQARLRGLKGRELDKFLEFPDKPTRELLETEGRKAIFSQENKFATRLNALLDHGLAEAVGADKVPALKETIKVFGRIVAPFRQFPINYVNTALNFAAPELAMSKAVYYMAKKDRRQALQNVGEAALGTMMYGAANYLWDNGIISEPTDKDAKQRSVQYEQMGPQRINISGLNRALDGGDGHYKLGDLTMDWGRLGIPSANFYVFTRNAANERKETARTGENKKSTFSPQTFVGDRLSAFPGMATFALDQSFLQGTASLLEAMRNPDPEGQELQNWATNTFRAVSSIAVPNSMEALARAEYQYIPELKGDNLPETLANVWKFKTLQLPEGDRQAVKRDLWGQPIARTVEGENAYVNQFLDVMRAERKTADPFKQGLVNLYQQTESPDVYPGLPQRNLTVEGITAKLLPKDYDHLQQYVGEARRMLAEQLLARPEFNDPKTLPEAKILALQQAYQEGAKMGRNKLLSEYGVVDYYFPDLRGRQPTKDSRVQARDPKARARLKMLESAQP